MYFNAGEELVQKARTEVVYQHPPRERTGEANDIFDN